MPPESNSTPNDLHDANRDELDGEAEALFAALIAASITGDSAALSHLLALAPELAKAQASPAHPVHPQATALMLAAFNGRADCVALLTPLSDTRAVALHGETALMHAAYTGEPECLAMLLPKSDVDVLDQFGRSALFLAAEGHKASRDRFGLIERDDRCSSPHFDSKSAWARAEAVSQARAERRRAECVALLAACASESLSALGQRLYFDYDESSSPWAPSVFRLGDATPLIECAERESSSCAAALLPYLSRDDLAVRDDNNRTALMAAVEAGRAQTVGLLIGMGNHDGQCVPTALLSTMRGPESEDIALLLPHLLPYADRAARDDGGRTLLIAAARTWPHEAFADALAIALPSERAATDNGGRCALAHAADGYLNCQRPWWGEHFAIALLASSSSDADRALATIASGIPHAIRCAGDAMALLSSDEETVADVVEALARRGAAKSASIFFSLARSCDSEELRARWARFETAELQSAMVEVSTSAPYESGADVSRASRRVRVNRRL